ncbi:hypothetical protein K438DRAFT_1780295 [Mycena galopus ATCC 62051]|nr:hypothetical protein K438DRAFT_1780295 [Mycena galopus ATCC 62051]
MSVDDQIAEHSARSLYQERPGAVYCNIRLNTMNGGLEVKGGWSSNVPRRQKAYGACECAEQEILWVASYECAEPKRVERLLHLKLREREAALEPRPCVGCGTCHREYFLFSAAGGFEGVLALIEEILGELGVTVNKNPTDGNIEERSPPQQISHTTTSFLRRRCGGPGIRRQVSSVEASCTPTTIREFARRAVCAATVIRGLRLGCNTMYLQPASVRRASRGRRRRISWFDHVSMICGSALLLRDWSSCDVELLPRPLSDLLLAITSRLSRVASDIKLLGGVVQFSDARFSHSLPSHFAIVGMLKLKTSKRKGKKKVLPTVTGALLATGVPQFTLNTDPAVGPAYSEQRPVAGHFGPANNQADPKDQESPSTSAAVTADAAPPVPPVVAAEAGAEPSYETMASCHATDAELKKARENVTHMDELLQEEDVFLRAMLDIQHDARLLSPCSCNNGDGKQERLRECWLDKHRNMPAHWALVWHSEERFFEKTDLCRVKPNAALFLGHDGWCCPDAGRPRLFTLVDTNGIHATKIVFCRCSRPNRIDPLPEFQQLLQAGIFPGSVKDPQTGYTLTLLEQFRHHRNQDKGSLYDFLHVLQRLADPFFAGAVPDLKKYFGNIVRYYHLLDIKLRRDMLTNKMKFFRGRRTARIRIDPKNIWECCINMPVDIMTPRYLRHLISEHYTLDGNFKANQFFKRDNGTNKALTNGSMYFPEQAEYDRISKSFVIAKEDKYANTAISGVVCCACDHAVVGSLVDMLKGEAFAFGTLAQREHLRQRNSPAPRHGMDVARVFSYDSWCAYCINLLNRALEQFPTETWLHEILELCEGQVAAAHINNHGPRCKAIWQAVYFGCRAHFHGESAERIWAFLNPLGSSTRQMNGGARHDTINFVVDAWNTSNVLRQAKLLSAERQDSLDLYEQHLAVVKYLSQKHCDHVRDWSRMSRVCKKDATGQLQSVYQHETSKMPTIDDVLDSIMKAERELKGEQPEDADGQPVSLWMNGGMEIERDQHLVVALLKSNKEHPLEETRAAINKLRDALNLALKIFRDRQRAFLPRIQLSAIDLDEPELTAVQLPSYLVKHKRLNATDENKELRSLEVKLWCVRAHEAIERAGVTRSSRAVQNALITKSLEITMYNVARVALINLGHMQADSDLYPAMSDRDTSRKETHLHRPKGDSRRFDGTAWYLQDGLDVRVVFGSGNLKPASTSGTVGENNSPVVLLSSTQMEKHRGVTSPRKRKNPTPDSDASNSDSEAGGSDVEEGSGSTKSPQKTKSPKKKKAKKTKSDGWIWLEMMTGRAGRGDEKFEQYKLESDRIQWFRAEAEMYRWREQYERKHAELMRVMMRFKRDGEVWMKRANHLEEMEVKRMGAVTYAREQAAMCGRLEHNARVAFQDPKSAAHKEWVAATTFNDLVARMDASREQDFTWMDELKYVTQPFKQFPVLQGSGGVGTMTPD